MKYNILTDGIYTITVDTIEIANEMVESAQKKLSIQRHWFANTPIVVFEVIPQI